MGKITVEQDGSAWLIVEMQSDGVEDVIEAHATRAAAVIGRRVIIQDRANTGREERHYQAQYDHACGLK